MKKFNWNIEKNIELKYSRGLSFEDILYYIEHDGLIDLIEHPKIEKYSNQKIYILDINNYVYYVPFVESEGEIFLKTIIPSRKLTKKYLKEKHENK